MGLTVPELEVASPARPAVTERGGLLIDSGAVYSVVPAAILERLGIDPVGSSPPSEATARYRYGRHVAVRRGS